MASEAQKRAVAKYDLEHTRQVKLKLNTATDADIIQRLNQEPNKQGWIKELIRKEIEAGR